MVVVLTAIALVAGCSPGHDPPEPSLAPSTASGTDPSTATARPQAADPTSALVDTFAGAGIAVVGDADGAEPLVPVSGDVLVVLTSTQADAMSAELGPAGASGAGGTGILGADLDEVTPMPASAPPFSYVVAAWLDLASTPRARAARTWFPDEVGWDQAPDLRFPHAALMLFVADNLEAAKADVPAPVTPPVARPARAERAIGTPRGALLADLPDTPCSTIAGFFSRQLHSIFAAIRLPPDFLASGGVLGAVSGFLAGLFNHAVALAELAVRGVVAALTAPVLQAIGHAVAIVGVVSHVSTYLFGLRVQVLSSADPILLDGGSGAWYALADLSSRPLDAPLQDCLAAFGQPPLPELFRAGAPVEWLTYVARAASGYVFPGEPLRYPSEHTATIPADGRVAFPWTATLEPDASGPERVGTVSVKVELPRAELTRLHEIAKRVLADAIAGVAADVPVLAEQARAALTSVLQPILDRLLAAASSTSIARGIFVVSGAGTARFVYHDPAPAPGGAATPSASCFVGSWAMSELEGGLAAQSRFYTWQGWTFDLGADGAYRMRAIGFVSGANDVGYGVDYDGSTTVAVTPRGGGVFDVLPPAMTTTPGTPMATSRLVARFVVGPFVDIDATRVFDAVFGLAFQPSRYECLPDGRLRIVGATDGSFAPNQWIVRRR